MKNKNVILVYPKMGSSIVRRPPLSILYMAAILEKNGYNPIIIDGDFDNYKEKITEAICVGISALTGHQILNGMEITRYIKKKFDMPVIWGGVHPTLHPEQTLETADIVVRGEGEITFLKLVEAISNNKPIDHILGISFKKNDLIVNNSDRKYMNMDEIPDINLDLVNLHNYRSSNLSSKNIALQTSRGCPHKCAFCYNMEFNSVWRAMSPEKVLQIVKNLQDKHKINGVVFWDDNFFVSSQRVKEICELFIKNELDLKWEGDCRIDYLLRMDDEMLKLLKKSGLSAMFLGAESGSSKILKQINKGITPEQIIESAKILKKYDLYGWYSFMLGFPNETKQDVSDTLDVMRTINKIYPHANTSIKIFTPYPGCPLFQTSINAGFKPPKSLQEWGQYNVENVNTPWPKHSFSAHFSLCTRFATEYDRISGFLKGNLFLRLIGYVIHKIEKFRLDYKFWLFPIELIIIKKIIKKM